MFESINELDKFIYDDCQITDIKLTDNNLIITLEALIVGARNSQNSNYTESYADTTTVELRSAKINSIMIEGYKQYDASDNLIEEVPDTPVPETEYADTISKMVNGFMFTAECTEKTSSNTPNGASFTYVFEVDMDVANEYGLQDPYCTTYQLEVSFSESRVTWDRYLNRVQK